MDSHWSITARGQPPTRKLDRGRQPRDLYNTPMRAKATSCVLTFLCALFVFGLVRQIPTSRDVPPDLSVAIIEATYPELFKHAYEVAIRGQVAGREEAQFDQSLPPEVIGIEVGRNGGYLGLGNRTWSKFGHGFLPISPTVGHPVLNKYWYTAEDGQRVTVIAYEALQPLRTGAPREINVCFELEGLRERLSQNAKSD